MTTWNTALQLNNIQATALTNPLNRDVDGNGFFIAGCDAPPFGTSAIVCRGTGTFLIEDPLNNPLLVVANTGLVLGGTIPNTVTVRAPTVTPSTDSSTLIATTAFVQSAIGSLPSNNLSSVLTAGNTATNSISLNNSGVGTNVINLLPNAGATDPQITLTDGTTTNTINKNGYTTRNSVQNIAHYLNFSDSSVTGTGAIQKTAGIGCNPFTNTVSATTFVGNLTGNADTATTVLNPSVSNTLNFPVSDFTVSKQSINYTSPTTIVESNIDAQIDGVANIEQVYTFGQSIPNRWVAVGQTTNTIAYSNDGLTWTGLGVASPASPFTTSGFGVAWNGTRWVAVGQGTNSIAYSSDGITWTGIGTSIFSVYGRGVAWNGTRWVAVGAGTNTIAYSSDGITWTGIGTSIFSVSGNGVAWNGTRFVAVGEGTNSIAYSSDGITWTGIGTSIFSPSGFGVAWNGTRFVAVGEGTNSIAYSANGISWTGIGTLIFSNSGFGVAWNGTRWVAVGLGINTIAYSSDGITWTGLSISIFSGRGIGVAWNGTRFVAGGNGTNSIAYSSDGITWTGIGTSIFTFGNGFGYNSARPNRIVFPTNRTVAVGAGTNTIAYSSDGLTWTGIGTSIFSTAGFGVVWNGTRFVAVGQGTNTIAYSSDGITWTGIGTSIFSASGRGVGWNGTRFIAVGDGTNSIAYSSNGINWTGIGTSIFSTAGRGVGWNAGKGGLFMSSITLNAFGTGLSNRLDVVEDTYNNGGYTNLSLTIKS